MKKDFMTSPEHVNFEAKKLFANVGEIIVHKSKVVQ